MCYDVTVGAEVYTHENYCDNYSLIAELKYHDGKKISIFWWAHLKDISISAES